MAIHENDDKDIECKDEGKDDDDYDDDDDDDDDDDGDNGERCITHVLFDGVRDEIFQLVYTVVHSLTTFSLH